MVLSNRVFEWKLSITDVDSFHDRFLIIKTLVRDFVRVNGFCYWDSKVYFHYSFKEIFNVNPCRGVS